MTDQHMKPISETNLSRRAFIKGAACLAGASILPIATASAAFAQGTSETQIGRSGSNLLLAYWDGARMIDPACLGMGMGGSHLGSQVRVMVTPHQGSYSTLLGLSALYPISNGSELTPYHAWAATEYGSHPGAFTMPIGDSGRLSLSVRHKSGGDDTSVDNVLHLTAGTDSNRPKLTAGTYVIASHSELSNCQLKADESGSFVVLHNGVPAKFDCLIVTVQRA